MKYYFKVTIKDSFGEEYTRYFLSKNILALLLWMSGHCDVREVISVRRLSKLPNGIDVFTELKD